MRTVRGYVQCIPYTSDRSSRGTSWPIVPEGISSCNLLRWARHHQQKTLHQSGSVASRSGVEGPSGVAVPRGMRATYIFPAGFQPWSDHSASDRFEDAPQKRFKKERCSLRYHRIDYLGYEDWHQSAFSIMCD